MNSNTLNTVCNASTPSHGPTEDYDAAWVFSVLLQDTFVTPLLVFRANCDAEFLGFHRIIWEMWRESERGLECQRRSVEVKQDCVVLQVVVTERNVAKCGPQ